MVTPELIWPTTLFTFASTSFWAPVVPCLGSALLSSLSRTNFASLPSILSFASLASSIASCAPFSLSFPRCAMPPVSGPAWPILISIEGGGGGALGASALASGLGAGACSPQPASATAVALSARASQVRCIRPPVRGRYDTQPPPESQRTCVRSLDGQDPLHQRPDVGVGHRRIGRHRRLAPDSLPAFLHFVDQPRLCVLLPGVLLRHVRVGRADCFRALDVMAGDAGVLLGERLARLGGCRGGKAGDDDCECTAFHAFPLTISIKCTRSLTGSRQVTPRHSQPLTGSGRFGFSGAGGGPRSPAGVGGPTRWGARPSAKAGC